MLNMFNIADFTTFRKIVLDFARISPNDEHDLDDAGSISSAQQARRIGKRMDECNSLFQCS
ncbi:MAG: hypothetical protein DMG75_03205 [Acidobacteria bacterium]|nr:MAG: hypothetical protein DMG75_03205 [Acidobacteriota bacterium]